MIKLNAKTWKITFFTSLVIFALALGTKLFLCGFLAVKNGELEDTFIARDCLKKEISTLRYENSRLSRIESIEERARQVDFIEMEENLLSLDVSAPTQVAVITQQ